MIQSILIPINHNNKLKGDLVIPADCSQLVIFSHGSGSSRLSPRNQYVAKVLNGEKIGTLLIDLLTTEEDELVENRFNIGLLTERLLFTTNHILNLRLPGIKSIGYFGASTGAASALNAAVKTGNKVHAIVSRGGRPDLSDSLEKLNVPTLFIVGSEDRTVIKLNQDAFDKLKCEKKIEIIEGATHLFEEAGALQQVALLAGNWFKNHYAVKESFHQH